MRKQKSPCANQDGRGKADGRCNIMMDKREDEVQKLVESMVRDGVVCGASLGFAGADRTRTYYYGEQGVVIPYSGRVVGAGLLYDLASLSKVVATTTRILQLAEQGKLGLDTGITDILPRFRCPGITVENLLLHDSGLPAEIRDKEMWKRECMLEYLYTTSPECGVGERFLYSDVGFILLGKVIEEVDHMTLEDSCQRHIFAPLGMTNTSFLTGKDPLRFVPTECTRERGCICGEVHDKKAFLMGPCGSAGVFSTLADVLLFVQAYLKKDGSLFGAAMFDRILSTERFGRTLGWSREYGAGRLYHTGFTGTSVLMDMGQGRGMALLANRIHPSRENEEFLHRREEINRKYLDGNLAI